MLEPPELLVARTAEDGDLPEGWLLVPLSVCVDVLDHLRVPVNSEERKRRQGPTPYYGATGQVGWIDGFLFDEPLVLLGEDGAPFLDKSKPITYLVEGKSWVNNHAHVLRARSVLTSNQFAKYFLDSFDFTDYVNGSTRLKLTQAAMNRIPVPLPPLSEQKRIVEKVEALLAQIDASRERLAKVPAILKRFRQAVLAAACSGRLTADWREDHRDVESAPRAIRRSREEALRQYETAREAARATGIRKPSRPKMLDPAALDSNELGELPASWAWITFEHVARDITVGHVGPMTGEYVKTGVPFLRSLNVREFRFDPTGLKFISSAFHRRLAKSALGPGDVAIVRTGNPGTSCVIPAELPEANCADLVVLRPSMALDPNYACIFLNSVNARDHINDVKVGIAQGHFNIGSMRVTLLPLPPLAEQHEIVRRVEVLFRLADQIGRHVTQATARAERLTQAVLAKAFRGELVPTEADLARREGRDYEPAVVLLERIRRERHDLIIGRGRQARLQRGARAAEQLRF